SKHCRKERVERAVRRRASLTGFHVGMTVPEFRGLASFRFVAQVLIDCRDSAFPHLPAIRIVKHNRALQKIFVVTVNRAADVAVGVGPLAGLYVDPSSY